LRSLAGFAAAAMMFMASPAEADLGPAPYQCPISKAHVWDSDQCARIDGGPFTATPGGGGGHGGLLGAIGSLLGL